MMEFVTVKEAADRTGRLAPNIYVWIKRGAVRSELDEKSGRVMVSLDDVMVLPTLGRGRPTKPAEEKAENKRKYRLTNKAKFRKYNTAYQAGRRAGLKSQGISEEQDIPPFKKLFAFFKNLLLQAMPSNK